MIQGGTFEELIKGLPSFDQQLVHALDRLKSRQNSTTVRTSRFELCHLLGLGYSPEHAGQIDKGLARLQSTPLHLPGPQSGFTLSTRAVTVVHEEPGSEKMTIVLGRLFTL